MDKEMMPTCYALHNKRISTANYMSKRTGYAASDIYDVLKRLDVHGNWTLWEINNRPVDYDELEDLIEEIIR